MLTFKGTPGHVFGDKDITNGESVVNCCLNGLESSEMVCVCVCVREQVTTYSNTHFRKSSVGKRQVSYIPSMALSKALSLTELQ